MSSPVLRRLLLAGMSLILMGFLGYRDLFETAEGRYAEISREMLETGDWLTPRLNGLKYFEKPPLQYWMTAAAFAVFGENAWSARLWTALLGLAGVGVVGFTGTRFFGATAGFYAALVTLSNLFYVGGSQINVLDMGASFFLNLTLCAFLLAQRTGLQEGLKRRWMAISWASMALGMLSKGLISIVFPFLSLTSYILFSRRWILLKQLYWRDGLLLLGLIGAPWFITVSLKNPEFFHFFFIQEHFQRFALSAHRRYEPWYYFILLLPSGLLPWTAFLPISLISAFKRDKNLEGFPVNRFLLLWLAVILSFFSTSNSKLPPYIIPLYPALGLLIGQQLAKISVTSLRRHLRATFLLIIIGFFSVVVFSLGLKFKLWTLHSRSYDEGLLPAYLASLGFSFVFLAAVCGAALKLLRRYGATVALTVFGLAGFFWCEGTILLHQQLSPARSAYRMAASIRPWLKDNSTFYSIKTYDQTLPFYLKHTLILVDYYDEFSLGIRQQPELFIPDLAQFVERWKQDPHPIALMPFPLYQQLSEQSLALCVIYRDPDRVVALKKCPSAPSVAGHKR